MSKYENYIKEAKNDEIDFKSVKDYLKYSKFIKYGDAKCCQNCKFASGGLHYSGGTKGSYLSCDNQDVYDDLLKAVEGGILSSIEVDDGGVCKYYSE